MNPRYAGTRCMPIFLKTLVNFWWTFGNVHKWQRPTFFSRFWPTNLACPTIFTLYKVRYFGTFWTPRTLPLSYPKIKLDVIYKRSLCATFVQLLYNFWVTFDYFYQLLMYFMDDPFKLTNLEEGGPILECWQLTQFCFLLSCGLLMIHL